MSPGHQSGLRELLLLCSLMPLRPTVATNGAAAGNSLPPPRPLFDADLFVGGQGGYACYRLPNLVRMRAAGHLLAVVQGHKYDCSDGGRMDILSRRSLNGGKTWGPPRLVHGESTPTKNVTMGTPAVVVDMVGGGVKAFPAGTVHLFICRDFKSVLLLSSRDSGTTWSPPRDLTKSLVLGGWTGVWTGLPQGIQLSTSGRLLVCANHGFSGTTTRPGGTHSHTIYSDDHATSWRNGNSVGVRNSTFRDGAQHMGECSLAATSATVAMCKYVSSY